MYSIMPNIETNSIKLSKHLLIATKTFFLGLYIHLLGHNLYPNNMNLNNIKHSLYITILQVPQWGFQNLVRKVWASARLRGWFSGTGQTSAEKWRDVASPVVAAWPPLEAPLWLWRTQRGEHVAGPPIPLQPLIPWNSNLPHHGKQGWARSVVRGLERQKILELLQMKGAHWSPGCI